MTAIRYICVASIARTGTSQLRRLLSAIPGIKAYGELFHPRRAATLGRDDIKAFGLASGMSFPDDQRDPGLVAVAGAMPALLLETLADQADGKCVAFKLFPSHLRKQDAAGLVRRPDMLIFLVSRKPIDSYISLRKARVSGSFDRVDTSGIRIDCEPDHFRRWFRSRDRWFEFVRQQAHEAGTKLVPLSFEDDIAIPEAHAVSRLRSTLENVGLSLPDGKTKPIESLPRQDPTTEYSTKMRNWEEFKVGLQNHGLYEKALTRFPSIAV